MTTSRCESTLERGKKTCVLHFFLFALQGACQIGTLRRRTVRSRRRCRCRRHRAESAINSLGFLLSDFPCRVFATREIFPSPSAAHASMGGKLELEKKLPFLFPIEAVAEVFFLLRCVAVLI